MYYLKKKYNLWAMTIIMVLCLTVSAFGQKILTAHEKSNFEEYTSYEEMLQFLQDIQANSTEMLLGSFGKTIEGREQLYAVFSRPIITQPWEALWSGKPIVLINANVHGGEKTLRESSLLFIRELTTKNSEANKLLDDLVIVAVPSINPDGFTRSSRGNSRGIDMNRDYMKLEQPELANFVKNIILTWHPHVTLDCHNGGSYPYNITYEANSHATPDQRITELCDFEIFPYINKKLENQGFKSFFYSGGDSTRWRGGGYDPRISRNYNAFIGGVGILLESPRQERKTGALCGLATFQAILQYVVENTEKVFTAVNRARWETIAMGQSAEGEIPVQMKYGPEDWKVSYEIAIGPRDNRQLVKITDADIVKKPIITKTRKRPYAYILEARAINAIKMLKQHNITIEILQEDLELEIEAYKVDSLSQRSEYDHRAAVTVHLADTTIKRIQMFPRGSYVVRTGQVMGRVASHLLEPETNDSVVHWNAMDAIMPRLRSSRRGGMTQARPGRQSSQRRAAILPIYKLMAPMPLPIRVLDY